MIWYKTANRPLCHRSSLCGSLGAHALYDLLLRTWLESIHFHVLEPTLFSPIQKSSPICWAFCLMKSCWFWLKISTKCESKEAQKVSALWDNFSDLTKPRHPRWYWVPSIHSTLLPPRASHRTGVLMVVNWYCHCCCGCGCTCSCYGCCHCGWCCSHFPSCCSFLGLFGRLIWTDWDANNDD